MTDNLEERLRSSLHAGPLPPAPDALYARLGDLAASRPRARRLARLRLAWSIIAVAGLLVVLFGALVLGTGTPTRSPVPTGPSASPIQSAETMPPPSWVTGTLDPRSTTPYGDFRSTGTYVIWSTGARTSGDAYPDLYGFEPGGQVQLLYDNPNRDTKLFPIAGSGGRFAFAEVSPAPGIIAGAWKLWYLPAVGATAVLVDSGAGQAPQLALSDRYLIWTVGHGNPEMSQVLVLDLTTSQKRVLDSQSPDAVRFWDPAIDGSHLVYGTVEHAGSPSQVRRVYYRDISTNDPPVRLDVSDSASEPAIHGDDVIWIESNATDDSARGSLFRYSISTHAGEWLWMPTLGSLGFSEPSVGNRYVAAWPETDRMLYLADLLTGMFPPILDLGPTNDDPHAGVGQPDVAGDLLAYVYWPPGGDAELRWIVLR